MIGKLILCWVIIPSLAFATDILIEPQPALYLGPAQPSSNFIGLVGDSSVANPTWEAAQWNNPSQLISNQRFAPNTDWQVANDTSSINFFHAPIPSSGILEHTYQLSQNGTAPRYPLACGTEFDLFLQPNSPNGYKTPSGSIAASIVSSSGPLNALSQLIYSFGFTVVYENTVNKCSLNYAAYDAAIILSSTKGKTIFYQIDLRDTRGRTEYNQLCPGSTTSVYCFDTSVGNITGQPMQGVSSGRVSYNFNLLPALKAAIATTSDTDLADWSMTGAYLGSLIQGGMVIRESWDSIRLVAY